jgi:uncharacterized protein
MQSAIRCPYFQKSFGWCVPIGGLAGLVGLGGGEFRLPVLMYVIGYPARTAVPLNLVISLVTLTFALVVRSRAVSIGALLPYLNEVVGLAIGGVASALYGARLVSAVKNEHLVKAIAALLAALGVLILFEVAYPFQNAQVIPAGAPFHIKRSLSWLRAISSRSGSNFTHTSVQIIGFALQVICNRFTSACARCALANVPIANCYR